MNITTATAAELTAAYASGELSPVDAAKSAIAAAEKAGELYNAVAVMNAEQALEVATESAARWAAGTQLGALDGVPVSVKDSFPMVGLKRWHGSALHDGAAPSAHDGAPVRRLREAGAVLFAKTSMPDFGLLGAGISSQFGIIRNPWNPALNPGGSSSGSGALLAAGAGPLSIGTDMGGSVRLPAALCGAVGLKPTQGRIAYDPPKIIGNAGPMARTVADAAALLEVIGAPDELDHLSLPGRFQWTDAVPTDLTGVSVALLTETGAGQPDVDPEIVAAVEAQAAVLERLGATVTRIPALLSVEDEAIIGGVLTARGMPELRSAPAELWNLLPAALYENFQAKLDMSAIDYLLSEKAMEAVRVRISAVYNAYDFVLSPIMPTLSFPAESTGPIVDGSTVGHMTFLMGYNLSSLPAGTVPVAMSSTGMPIGVQVGGRRFDDGRVLALLALLERERGFALDYPVVSA